MCVQLEHFLSKSGAEPQLVDAIWLTFGVQNAT